MHLSRCAQSAIEHPAVPEEECQREDGDPFFMIRIALFAALILSAGGCAPDPSARLGARPGGAFFAVTARPEEGKLLVTLPKPDEHGVLLRAIHACGLTAGLGSNPVGLDRGAVESGRIIAFRKIGPKVVVDMENWTYRASASAPPEQKSVADSFARSFLWATDLVKEKPDGSVVLDLAGFLTADTMDLRGSLKNAGQGTYAVAADRSFPDYSSVLVFPDNVELDAFVTLTADAAGSEAAATAADGRAVTLTLHHSFVRLPGPGFKPRDFDARIGAIDVPYYDFSAPLAAPIAKAYARRFRLERLDAGATSGPVKKPIVFHVDPGAPEPVRQALMDGASWWADAFKAAGFEDAFRVELLPKGAHPMDARYNVIQWVHRQTRGWSYGGGISDPRTGEMIKAAVILGSQRVRQDRRIFEGLAGAERTGTGGADDPIELALARIRQLSAHEVGHPLGFAHNFAASANDRASVMDYPAPHVRPTADGRLDFGAAYAAGIGEWDKVAVRWLYSEFPQGTDETAALDQIIRDAYASGLRFMDDAQGRDVAGAHPVASVWDNGSDPVAMLEETLQVRRIALTNFGERSLKSGQPTSDLRALLVPVYLYHRYQVAAAAKLIGGYDFRYASQGDGPASGAPVSAGRQRAALAALTATLRPAALDLPDTTVDALTPPAAPFTGGASGETFPGDLGPMFDLLRAADAAGAETLHALLHPRRLARLVEMERRRADALSVGETLRAIEATVFAAAANPRQGEIARTLQTRFVSTLMDLAAGAGDGGADAAAPAAVQARVDAYLRELHGRLAPGPPGEQAHRAWLGARIDAHLSRPAPARLPSAPAARIPPGPPIGAASAEQSWFGDLE